MKNKIFLTEDESNRILNLHKKATKESRLNEQYAPMVADNTRVATNFSPLTLPKPNFGLPQDNNNNSITPAQQQSLDGGWGPITASVAAKLPVDANGNIIPKVTTQTTTAAPVVQKPAQSVTKPLIMKIQQTLKEKGINLGATGPNKDGVDGVMGKITLNGIVGLLGGTNTAATTTTTTVAPSATTPTGTAATTPTGTAATTPTGTAATTPSVNSDDLEK
jgi:hypothetical protein